MRPLTERQCDILRYIMAFSAEQGYPPSIREIGAKFSIHTTRGVTSHLDSLERKGCLSRVPSQCRTTRVTQFGHEALAGRTP